MLKRYGEKALEDELAAAADHNGVAVWRRIRDSRPTCEQDADRAGALTDSRSIIIPQPVRSPGLAQPPPCFNHPISARNYLQEAAPPSPRSPGVYS
jgi:hypothetical protein